jgi:hypothetical protein
MLSTLETAPNIDKRTGANNPHPITGICYIWKKKNPVPKPLENRTIPLNIILKIS